MHVPPGQEIQPHRDESPASRDQATGTLRSAARQVPPGPRSSERGAHGAAHTALFGEPRAEPHRGKADGTLRRAASRTSPGAAHTALFGGPRAELHRSRADGTLRRAASRASSEPRTRHSSEGREQSFIGTGSLPLFGGAVATSQRGRERTVSSGPGNRSSSEPRAPSLTRGLAHGTLRSVAGSASPGPGRRHSSERREPSLTRESRSWSSSERRTQPPTGNVAAGALRSAGRSLPPGQGHPSSSEHRRPRLTEIGTAHLIGKPISRASRGTAGRRPSGKASRVYALPSRWGCGRLGHRLTSAPRSGRTVTTGRQRPQ